ncbi:hypothetical protein ACHAXR_009941 [Thalassiosira sp. AJA248-18]
MGDENDGSSNGDAHHHVPLNQVAGAHQLPVAAASPSPSTPGTSSWRPRFSIRSSVSFESTTAQNRLSSSLSAPDNNGDNIEEGGSSSGSAMMATAGGNAAPATTHRPRSVFRPGGVGGGILRRDSGDNHQTSPTTTATSTSQQPRQPQRYSMKRRASTDSNRSDISSNNSIENSDRLGAPPSRTGTTKRSTFRLPLFSPSTNNIEDSIDVGFGGLSTAANSNSNGGGGRTTTNQVRSRITALSRRYGVGDYVLISNHGSNNGNTTTNNNININNNPPPPSHSINLVNRYGFPSWGGGATTSEERRGPYIHLLAQVTSVHFGEDAQYYTVRRMNDNQDQRADAQWMEPITNPVGIEAAKAAAQRRKESDDNGVYSRNEGRDGRRGRGIVKWLRHPCCTDAVSNYCTKRIYEYWKKLLRRTKRSTDGCLNGNRPYGISCRFTGVNFFVLCSIWYLYIDQLRLAFMPHSADYGCAVVSCIVWVVLFLELVMEVFIRPNGYRALIRSDKAYLPSTVRYLNTFHLISEMISLIFFIPEFMCIFSSDSSCGDRYAFSLANACLMSLYGPDRLHAFYGTAFICILRLRIFGLVRHWTKMWINNTFVRVRGKNGEWRVQRGKGFFVPQGHRGGRGQENVTSMEESISHQTSSLALTPKNKLEGESSDIDEKKHEFTDDYHLTNASKIGTALFTTNAQRGLLFAFFIGLLPLVSVMFRQYGGTNQHLQTSVELLQSNNIALNATNNETCAQLRETTIQWVKNNAFETLQDGTNILHVLSLEVEPVRCDFQKINGTDDAGTIAALSCEDDIAMERCSSMLPLPLVNCEELCMGWGKANEDERLNFMERFYGIRPSVTVPVTANSTGTYEENGEIVSASFSVRVLYNEELSVRRTIIILFTLQLAMTLFVLLGLSVLRADAGRLVLGPLRRMLKIVAFYAKNPLSPPPRREGKETSIRNSFQMQNEAYYDSDDETSDEQLGNFETEQLINAVTKITDLLRKCWGVAGAGIISSNLARQEGGLTTYFNPTVPGKAVYALFAFAVIDKFQSHLHALKGDIMILINDIAAVLHEEVYRWGYEESGQCNKNLGGAFLMVYKIGAVSEVLEKRERAEAVIFSAKSGRRKSRRVGSASHLRASSTGSRRVSDAADKYSRSHVDNIDLSSLPGMRTFTDRALLGLLKTFASIHRDKVILNWNNDFRLGAGVGAVSINLNYGMDAGWAVEGAVGSSYKIDATYLSPHVNMASRMMSATKQYGVFILLSQAVQKLLTENAQDKLRHIDTVTVKGSSVQQRIYTYDAKVRNDFFLYSKTEDQADLDSERYSPAIWNVDQDLVAMRNHVCDEFIEVFNRGRDEYLAGNWPAAIKLLKSADRIMFECEVDEGYSNKSYGEHFKSLTNLDDNDEAEERLSMGDGPCQRLIAYMEEMGGNAPSGWRGYRPLTSK